jgi:hypothetical protein
VTVFSKTFLSFVSRHLMSFPLFSARHSFKNLYNIVKFFIRFFFEPQR